MALPPIIGTGAVGVLDCRDVRGVSIVEFKTDLAFDFMRHSPRPRFERVEVRLMELVPDPPELHTRLPPPNGGALGCQAYHGSIRPRPVPRQLQRLVGRRPRRYEATEQHPEPARSGCRRGLLHRPCADPKIVWSAG